MSNGGVWYSVKWPDNSLGYCGHLRDKEDIKRSIENVCLHLLSGGQLVLSVQEAHQDKKIQLSDDIVYEQRIEDIGMVFLIKNISYLNFKEPTSLLSTSHIMLYR